MDLEWIFISFDINIYKYKINIIIIYNLYIIYVDKKIYFRYILTTKFIYKLYIFISHGFIRLKSSFFLITKNDNGKTFKNNIFF